MRDIRMRIPAAITCVAVIGLLVLSGNRATENCAVTLKLIDADNQREISGLIRIQDADGEAVNVAGLFSRGQGLDEALPISRWSVVPKQTVVRLPRKTLTITALSGLETEQATVTVNLTGKDRATLTVPLRRFVDASQQGSYSGNTHLHLQKITREMCDRYLLEIPKADGLDLLFLSYLERAGADREYTSNKYTDGDLASLSKKSGVVFGNGEEHRHNFAGFGQGYGHVMLLDIEKLIQPVSIGPGIMKMGTDGLPLARGIETARRDGATIIWCHNNWGMEELPNLLAGRIDAQNIFDGGTHGSFKNSYYRYLNAGIRVPFSTGTDWLMYDFSRVYVDMKGDVTVKNWLKGLANGRSYITNGPLLKLKVQDKSIGETLSLKKPTTIRIVGEAVGRIDFGRVELAINGKVVAKSKTERAGGHVIAKIDSEIPIDRPCWVALRTPPPPVKDDPALTAPVARNELGRELFAHTSAVNVEVNGQRHFDRAVAGQLLAEMKANVDSIQKNGTFADDQERQRVLDVYRDGIAEMTRRLKRSSK
ncbi:MAG: CehA/McbA family metallohydrolase [Planctomycetaceae bacterium]|nr:CehA/McbA family metallohydrolase [Planctomycetaceae bacterium]